MACLYVKTAFEVCRIYLRVYVVSVHVGPSSKALICIRDVLGLNVGGNID
jgi:hypothetical protein